MGADGEIEMFLHGVKHHYIEVRKNEKLNKLIELLRIFSSKKVMIFLKSSEICATLVGILELANLSAKIYTGNTAEDEQQSEDVEKVITKPNLLHFKYFTHLDQIS